MAAPPTAYLNNGSVLAIHIPGVIKLNSVLALKLAEYGANIKSLFYLDYLLVLKNPTTGQLGFAGACIVGGANLAYHANARYSRKRLKNGVEVIVFNDGGLNTKGYSTQPGAATTTDLRAKLVSILYKTAYYVPSTEFGIIVKQSAAAPSLNDPYFVLRVNQAQNATYTLTNVTIGNLTSWVTLYVYSVNKNTEGVRIEPTARTVYVNGDAITLAFQNTQPTNSGEVTGIDNTFYTDADTSNGFPGGRISSDLSSFAPPQDGFYVSRAKERWYQVTGGFIVNEGTYTAIPPGFSEYKYYEIANFACGEAVVATRTLLLDQEPIISSGSIAPDGLGDGIYRTAQAINTGTIFTVYQSLECPGGGISCAEEDKIIVFRIGSVTNC